MAQAQYLVRKQIFSQHSSRAGVHSQESPTEDYASIFTDLPPPYRLATYADTAGRRCWKQSRQSTGRPCVGLNGTVVSLPHCEQTARVSVLDEPRCPPPLVPKLATRFALQALQRLGSFLNCLSWKNICSPEVKTKSAPQSMHFNILS